MYIYIYLSQKTPTVSHLDMLRPHFPREYIIINLGRVRIIWVEIKIRLNLNWEEEGVILSEYSAVIVRRAGLIKYKKNIVWVDQMFHPPHTPPQLPIAQKYYLTIQYSIKATKMFLTS